MTALTEICLSELTEKYGVEDAVFLVDSAPWLKTAFMITGSDFDTRHTEIGTLSSVFFKRQNDEPPSLETVSETPN